MPPEYESGPAGPQAESDPEGAAETGSYRGVGGATGPVDLRGNNTFTEGSTGPTTLSEAIRNEGGVTESTKTIEGLGEAKESTAGSNAGSETRYRSGKPYRETKRGVLIP
jgi:hypothetical protein